MARSYSNDYSAAADEDVHAELTKRFLTSRGSGFTAEQTAKEVERCLNCDIQTNFTANLCIECDACIDVCPVNCLTITPDTADDFDLRAHLSAPATNPTQDIYTSAALPQTKRIMVKDEDVSPLRPLPDVGRPHGPSQFALIIPTRAASSRGGVACLSGTSA
jgi:ferredoxin